MPNAIVCSCGSFTVTHYCCQLTPPWGSVIHFNMHSDAPCASQELGTHLPQEITSSHPCPSRVSVREKKSEKQNAQQ
eukprot:8496-Heterococcus_DN1.PRE.7